MNSKNFTAAEKHFAKKQEQYERQIKSMRSTIVEQNATLTELSNNNQKLKVENAQLKDWVDRLLEYTELSEADIKAACEKDKKLAELCGMFGLMSRYLA